MLIAGNNKTLVTKVVNAIDGLPTDSGVTSAVIWRESDGYFWDGSAWVDSGVSAGTPTHKAVGNWEFVFSGTATTDMEDDTIYYDMSDSADGSGVNGIAITSAGGEHKVHRSEPTDLNTVSGFYDQVLNNLSLQDTLLVTISGDLSNKPDTGDLATASGIATVVETQLSDDFAALPQSGDFITASGMDDYLVTQHGAGNWITASGFTTSSDLTAHELVISGYIDTLPQLTDLATKSEIAIEVETQLADDFAALPQTSGIATVSETATGVGDLLTTDHGGGTWQTASGFSTHSEVDVDTQLSSSHGAGDWTSTPFINGVYVDAVYGLDTNTGDIGSPVQTLQSGIIIASGNNVKRINLAAGDYTHDFNLNGFEYIGAGPGLTIIDQGFNYTADQATFRQLTWEPFLNSSSLPNGAGTVYAEDCYINGTLYAGGHFKRCRWTNNLYLTGEVLFDHCSNRLGFNVYLNGNGFRCQHWSGMGTDTGANSISFADAAWVDSWGFAYISQSAGIIDIDSTIVDGDFYFHGTGKLVNNGSPSTLQNNLVDPDDIANLGFQEGAVWCSPGAGSSTGKGTAEDPVDTLDGAITVASSKNLNKIMVVGAGTVTPTISISNYEIIGVGSGPTINLNNVSCTDAHMINMVVFGDQGSGSIVYVDSLLTAVTDAQGVLNNCRLIGSISFINGIANVAQESSSLTVKENAIATALTMSGAGNELTLRRYSGYVEILGMDDSASVLEIDGSGAEVEINANCTAGTVRIRGDTKYIDNSGGAVTIDDQTGIVDLGFKDGGVWCSPGAGSSTGAGTAQDPVDTIDGAISIASSKNLKRIMVVGPGLVTPTSSLADYEIIGVGAGPTINLNSQVYSDARIERMVIFGDMDGNGFHARECLMTLMTGANLFAFDSVFIGANSFDDISFKHLLQNCTSTAEAAFAPSFSVSGATQEMALRGYTGLFTLTNLSTGGVVEVDGAGAECIIDASCGGGTVRLRGDVKYTDNSGGAVTIDDQTGGVVDVNAIASGVNTELTGDHGSGSWTTASGVDLDANQVAIAAASGVWTSANTDYNDANTMGALQNAPPVEVSGIDLHVYSVVAA
jgi:hypothetical protein